MAKDMPMLALTLELLQSIPGIDLSLLLPFWLKLATFQPFSKPGKLVAYFGIDPSVMQSGEFTGTQNKMSKRGQDCFAEYFSQLLLLISAPSGTKQLATLY